MTITLLSARLTSCFQKRMSLYGAFKGLFGFSADSSTEYIAVGESSDGSCDDKLSALGAIGGQKVRGQRGFAVIQQDESGEESEDRQVHQSSAVKSSSKQNCEAVPESSSDDDGCSRLVRPLNFKISDDVEVTECEHYLSSVLNWTAEPFVGRHALKSSTLSHIQFGPYTLAELQEALKIAADAAGFSIYAHKGARKSTMSCSQKFGCEHGRQRYRKEQHEIDSKSRDFN